MDVILCGWCGKPTPDAARCECCRHAGPRVPWDQRAEPVPVVAPHDGRPPLDDAEIRRRLAALGPAATVEQLADHFDVDPRTVRRWRHKVSA